MAKITTVQTFDDFDLVSPATSVVFGLHGTSYSIDLSANNQLKLEQFLAPFIARSTVLGALNIATAVAAPARAAKKALKRKAAKKVAREHSAATVRAWAMSEGLVTSSRGRLAESVYGAYARHLRSLASQKRYPNSPLAQIAAMEKNYSRATILSFALAQDLIQEGAYNGRGRLPMAVYLAFEEHVAELEAQAKAVIAAAEEVAAAEAKRLAVRASGAKRRVYPSDLRPWAREKGLPVSNGAVDQQVLLAYALEKPGALV